MYLSKTLISTWWMRGDAATEAASAALRDLYDGAFEDDDFLGL